jgi:hypothetical protein
MHRLGLCALVVAVGCGSKVVEDPFGLSTDPAGTGTDPTLPSTTQDGTATGDTTDTEATTDVPSTTSPLDTTVDPGTGTGTDTGPAECGDGVVGGDEVCDGEDFGELSCQTLGFGSGVLVCNPTCQGYSSEGCYNCNNGVLEAAEQCEGELPGGVDCESEGFTTGTLSCNAMTCQFDTSQCSLCGNGIVEGAEPCDGDDLAGLDCAGIGFEQGELGCADNCSYDFSGCSGGQYIQDFEGGMLPGELDTGGNAVWIVDSGNPIAGAWSAASGVISHNQSSTLTLPATFAIAGTVEFTHEESTESNYDYLEFWLDGVMQAEWSGANAAQAASYPVAAGAHTLEWRYTKDGSVNSGSDRVWVDDIRLTGGVPN